MKLLIFAFVFLMLWHSLFCHIYFRDCGSHNIEIERIDIAGCRHTPCSVRSSQPFLVYITPLFLGPYVDSISLSAMVQVRGARVNCNAVAINPCIISSCPLSQTLVEPQLQINVTIPSLIPGQAFLTIDATYLHRRFPQSRFCVEFDVDVD